MLALGCILQPIPKKKTENFKRAVDKGKFRNSNVGSALVNSENIDDFQRGMGVRKENSDCMLEGWGKEELVVISELARESEPPPGDCAYNVFYTSGDYIHSR